MILGIAIILYGMQLKEVKQYMGIDKDGQKKDSD
jgi:hypothetical protein